MSSLKKLAAIVVVLAIAGGAYAARGVWRPMVEELGRPSIPVATPYQPVSSTRPTSSTPALPIATSSELVATPEPEPIKTEANPFTFAGTRPAEMNLAVPFMLQAPKQNWDMPYQEACEETSLLMVQQFLSGRTSDPTADESDRLILDLVAYEESQGDQPDVTLARIGQIANERYGFKPVIQALTSMDQVRNAVANGYPVILPASGKELNNPNFRNGGPPYHMFVVRGYLKDGTFLTNDPGTRKGKEYIYTENILFNAVHDWNGGDVPNGDKVVLVLMPKQ